MRVPFADPARMSEAEAGAVRAAIEEVLAGPRWVLGDQVTGFEAEFASYLGAPEGSGVGVGSGTDALVLALLALGLPAGSGVLVAADEGGYAATAARLAGLVPVAVDVGAAGGPTVDTIAGRCDERTSALVVTHLHGDPVPMAELDRWRRGRGLALVEDCAQAHGLRVAGRHVGLTGDAATFSFYPTKNLGAVGDAGLVVLPDPEAAGRARQLREYGWGERYRVRLPGGRNSRLDEVQAGILRARLPFLDERNARRRAIAARYAELVPLTADPVAGVAHHAVALVEERDRVAAELERRGVGTAVHYPWLVTEMPGLELAPAPTPVAGHRRERLLSLPCFPELSEAEADIVCTALTEVLR